MLPGTYNIEVYQGDDFELPLRLRTTNPDNTVGAYKDLTDHVPTAQVRQTPSTVDPMATFTCVLGDQTDPDQLGLVTLTLDKASTATMPATPTNGKNPYWWDFQLEDPAGKVHTYVRGTVKVIAEVTR